MKRVLLSLLTVVAVLLTLNACAKSNCKHDDPTQVEILEAKAATCQESGLTEGLRCNLCGVMVIPQAVVQATECTDLTYIPYKAPSCQSVGHYGGEMCEICGRVVVQPEILPKIECKESDWIVDKEATISMDGARHTECTMCGKVIQQQIIAAGTQGLEYDQNTDGTYTLDGFQKHRDTEIVIPRMYNGHYVTSIGSFAFSNDSVRSIVIPDTVITIQSYAFSGCSRLDNLIIPDGVQSIGSYCFKTCESLKNIDIPDSVTLIENGAFWGCESLKTVIIPKSITKLKSATFYKCTSLTTIIYEGTIEEWNNVEKHHDLNFSWNTSTGEYTVYCTDGEITKSGTVTYY